MNKKRLIHLIVGPVLMILFAMLLPNSIFTTFESRAAVGYGLQPKYMLKEGWKMTVLVITLMSVLCYLMLTYWPAFSTT